MAAVTTKVVGNADGGYSLVSVIGGVTVAWSTVNPSHLAEQAQLQGKNAPKLPDTTDDETEG